MCVVFSFQPKGKLAQFNRQWIEVHAKEATAAHLTFPTAHRGLFVGHIFVEVHQC